MLASVSPDATPAPAIRTPDQRLRVFVSSTLQELAEERLAVRDAVKALRLIPVMFELGARAHPPRQVYRAYLAQSQVFVGVYWQSYGWVAPGEGTSGLEDEYRLSAGMPRLIYVKSPAPGREPRLAAMLARIKDDDSGDEAGAAGHTMDTLSSLVDSSLVRPEPREDEPRFSLLETIREYALERLRESGDWQHVHDRHATYFLSLAEPARAELHGAGQLAWLNRLEIRRGNLSAALSWLTGAGQLGPALHLIWTTWRFWWLHGHAGELARHVDAVLAKSASLPPGQRALALSAAGFVQFAGGDQARARRLFKQSLPLYRQAGDRLGMGLTAAALGHLLAARHEVARASDLLDQTLRQLREMADGPFTEPQRVQYLLDVALASNFLGQIQLGQGDHRRAAELFTDGLSAAHSAADRFTILVSLYDLALSRQAGGDLDDAADLLRQGLSLAAEAGDEPGLAYYLEALAAVAVRRDQPERAASLLAVADALLEAKGSGWLHAYVPRAPHDESVLARLRARTTDVAFQQAWTRGRSLTSASAVRYALEETTGRPARPALAAS